MKNSFFRRILGITLCLALAISSVSGAAFSVSAAANNQSPVYWEQVPIVNDKTLNNGYSGGEGCQWPNAITISKTDPNFLILATDVGGVYVTYNGGEQWMPSNVGLSSNGATAPTIDPKNANRVLMVGGNGAGWDSNGMYLSEDKGKTWKQVLSKDVVGYRNFKHSVAWDESSYDSILGGCKIAYWAAEAHSNRDNGALFKTTDGGKTWKEIHTSTYTDGWVEVNSKGWVFIGNKNGLYRSKDGGSNFAKIMDAPNPDDITINWDKQNLLGVTGLDMVNDTLYVTKYDGVYVSSNGGDSFNKISVQSGIKNLAFQRIAVSPADTNYMFVSVNENDQWNNINNIYYTHDGGKNWSKSTYNFENSIMPYNDRQDIFALHPTNRNVLYSIGCDTVVKSSDGGAVFEWKNSGYAGIMEGAHIGFNPNNPDLLFVTSQDYNGALSIDGTTSFNYTDVSGYGWGGWTYGAMAISPNLSVTASRDWDYNYELRVTHNGGKSWVATGIMVKGLHTVYNDPKNANVIYAYEYRSLDGGYTWVQMSGCKGVFTSNPTNGDVYGADGKWVVKSSDYGQTWQKVVEMPVSINDIAYDHSRNKVYATGSDKLYVSINGGAPYQVYDALPKNQKNWFRCQTVAVDPVDPDVVYVGGAANIYISDTSVARSTDGGNTWVSMVKSTRSTGTVAASDSLDGGKEAQTIRVNPETREVYVGTCCLGIWKTTAPGSPLNGQVGMPLIAARGNSKVALKWFEGNTGASFEVYRSTSAASGFTKIATTTSTSYTDSSRNNGTTYYYKVKNLKTGNYTKTAYATPSSAAPKYVNAIGQDGFNEISWSTVAGGVSIYRSESKNGTYTKIADNVSGTSYIDNVNGNYWYKVALYDNQSAQSEAKPSFVADSNGNELLPVATALDESFSSGDAWSISGYSINNALENNYNGSGKAITNLSYALSNNFAISFKYSVNKNGTNAWNPSTTVKYGDYSIYIGKASWDDSTDEAVIELRKNGSRIGDQLRFDSLFDTTFTFRLTKYQDDRVSLSVETSAQTKVIKATDNTNINASAITISCDSMYNYSRLSDFKATAISYAPSVTEPVRTYSDLLANSMNNGDVWSVSGYSVGSGKLTLNYNGSGSATTNSSYTLGDNWRISFNYRVNKNGSNTWDNTTTFTFGNANNKYELLLRKDNYDDNNTLTVILKKNGSQLGSRIVMDGHFDTTHKVTITCDGGYVYVRIDENDDNKAMVVADSSPVKSGTFGFSCYSMYNFSEISSFVAQKAGESVNTDKVAADAVIAKINAIGTVTLNSESAINSARSAYDNLTSAQKSFVTNYNTLTSAESKLSTLKAEAEQAKADKAAADAVIAKINAIGTVTLNSESAINSARSAYDALTSVQKALVTNYSTLESAEKTLEELKNKPALGEVIYKASGWVAWGINQDYVFKDANGNDVVLSGDYQIKVDMKAGDNSYQHVKFKFAYQDASNYGFIRVNVGNRGWDGVPDVRVGYVQNGKEYTLVSTKLNGEDLCTYTINITDGVEIFRTKNSTREDIYSGDFPISTDGKLAAYRSNDGWSGHSVSNVVVTAL